MKNTNKHTRINKRARIKRTKRNAYNKQRRNIKYKRNYTKKVGGKPSFFKRDQGNQPLLSGNSGNDTNAQLSDGNIMFIKSINELLTEENARLTEEKAQLTEENARLTEEKAIANRRKNVRLTEENKDASLLKTIILLKFLNLFKKIIYEGFPKTPCAACY